MIMAKNLDIKGCSCGGGAARHVVLWAMLLCLAAHSGTTRALTKMQLVHSWGSVDFIFESEQQRKQMEASGVYKQGNAVPFDVDYDPSRKRIFVALPSTMPGGAVTLASVPETEPVQSPRLKPYPDWSWHAGARGCEGLTSVFRVQVDRCGRLWVVDSGVVDVSNEFERRCPPQLFVFDLTNDQLLLRHRFDAPQAVYPNTLLLNVVVELMGDADIDIASACRGDAFAYIADAGENALFVFSLQQKRSWRVEHDLFYPDVNARQFRVAGTSMNLMDGVVGLAVSPRVSAAKGPSQGTLSAPDTACQSHLYFHALTSFQEGRVCTSVLRNASLFQDGSPDEAFQFIGRREGQSASESFTTSGVLFFSPVNKNSINCWNQRKKYESPNLPAVEQDDKVIRFVTGLKVVPYSSATGQKMEELWVISNNAQLLFTGRFQPNVSNTINIIRANTQTLLKGSNC